MYKTENSKLNLQGKLCLKRSNSDSMQDIPNSDRKINFENEARQQTIHSNNQSFHKENLKFNSDDIEDDSLADFKSPKQETVQKPILNKYKIDALKTNKKIAIVKTKSTVKSRKSDINQPSIEASLLKPQTSNQNQTDVKEAVPCPLCLKPFKDDTTCIGHMKSCAAKNNVSIKQLLEAKRLQDRQAQERKAIGLLAAPILSGKKKPFRSRNFSTKDDPQLQLVLAMSESLYEAESMVKLEEAAVLAGIPSECITEMNDEERKKTLQSFGFTTNKPIADIPTNKQRKKKLLAPTVLQTRSKEDKDRVLTERIACILTGEDAITQVQKNTAINFEHKTSSLITSKLLKEIEQTDNKLWDQSRLTKQFHNFYVNELKYHFVKSTKQPDVKSEIHESLAEDCEKQNAQTLNTSIVYEPMDLDIIINNQSLERDSSNCEIFNMNGLKRDNFEFEFVQILIDGWKEALNDSSASDVVIFVKNNRRIYAHKLVFHVQCPNILLDIEPLDAVFDSPIEKKISWLDKEQDSALAFLEFIYSGTISKYVNIFFQEELVHQVEQLARHYKKQNLFAYVRKKQQEFRFQRKDSEQLEHFNNIQAKKDTNRNQSIHLPQKLDNPKNNENILLETQVAQENLQISIHCSADKLAAKHMISNNLMTEQLIDRRITASPDLFESEEDEANSSRVTIKYNPDSENDPSAKNNIKEEIDDVQDSDESEHLNSQRTLVNLSRSISPLENIHEAITPPSGRSPQGHSNLLGEDQIFNEREITEAVTPKCQSPEKIVDVKQEIVQSDALATAVTPEYVASTELSDYVIPTQLVCADVTLNDITAQDHINESIHTAVTPPRRKKESGQMIDENIHKIKSELTMFVEKVRRKNAKDIMDTDSETDSPDNRIRHKNPFLKKDQDDSYRYLQKNTDKKYHKAISLLEKDLLDEQKVQKNLENVEIDFDESIKNSAKSLRNDNPSTSKLQVPSSNSLTSPSESAKENVSLSDDEVQDITVNKSEMSMYTKYKNSNKCNNSIAFYRKQLGFDGRKICSDDRARTKSTAEENSNDPKLSENSRSTVSQSASAKKPKPRIIEDITLVSDSDEEESLLRTFLRDKSQKKIDRRSPVAGMSNKDSKVNTATPAFNIENNSAFPLELINEPLDSSKDSKLFHSAVLENESKNKVIDLSADSDEGSIYDNSTIPHNDLLAQSDISLRKPKSFVIERQTSIDKRKELEKAEKKSEDIDAEISKILQSNQQITNVDESSNSDQEEVDNKEEFNEDKNANNRVFSSESKIVDLSPISIVSSPELCELDKIDSQKSKNNNIDDNKTNNYSQNSENSLAPGENGDFDLLPLNDWNVKTPPKETLRNIEYLEKSSRASSSVRKLNYDDSSANRIESDYFNARSNVTDDKALTLISSPILSQNRRSLGRTQNKSSKISDKLKNNAEDTIKLKVKSASTSTLTGKMGEANRLSSQRCSSFVTPEQNDKSLIDHKDMTPPLDYSLLDTPNLQRELRKFGLKPQSRTKAKALLTHIYKETHSQPSASQKRISNTDSSSEEDEPPAKRRQYVKRATERTDDTNKHYSKTEEESDDCSVIAEEMVFDDPEVASVFQNPVSIKDAFFKLIKTNRELYNKVLTYEPFTLETLHSMLKQNGFKCQLNSLMDFLDEQCITFQVKAGKGDRIKK